MTNESANGRDAFDEIAETFVARYRAGERPSVEEYARRCPEMADELRELLPTLVLLERHAASDEAATGGPSPQFVAPRQIGDFTIVREIGRGGMGVVYEAVQQSLGRHVALKVLSGAGLLNPLHLERFRLEARAAARLHHTHIVPVFGVGEHDQLHYYAMQFIQGQSLDQVIDALRELRRPANANITDLASDMRTLAIAGSVVTGEFQKGARAAAVSRPSPVAHGELQEQAGHSDDATSAEFTTGQSGWQFYRSVARVGMQAAEALAYAHNEGVLHRDIKPSNLMLDAKGHLWITDFGLAKAEGSDGLTQTGDFVGTLRYMAPERLDGGCDRRSDVYGLGTTLYELVTLRTFLEDGSRGQLVDRILHDAPPAPSKFDKSIPRDLETIILKAIAKEPAARYRTAEAMAEDLRRFLADRPVLARRSTPAEQFIRWCRRNPLVAGLTGALAALLVAAVAILAVSNAHIRRASEAKDAALATAYRAVDQMLTRVASDRFSDIPMAHPLRQALLEDALRLYEGFGDQADNDQRLQTEIANVLFTMAGLQRELGRYAGAVRSLQECINLLRAASPTDPDPPALREQLALAELDLAYTMEWSTSPPQSDDPAVEAQYRKALRQFQQLEQDWPQRRQAYVACLRYLARLELRRGDLADAERTWQDAIARGEAYLDQHADDVGTRVSVCWGCMEYYDGVLGEAVDRAENAEEVVQNGLRHVEIALAQKPSSIQAREVAASLHFCMASLLSRTGRGNEATPIFQQAVEEIESLCASFPWNPDYWNTAHWLHQDTIAKHQQAGRDDDAKDAARRMYDWLRSTAPLVPDQPKPQQYLRCCQREVIELLRSTGLEDEANDLNDAIRDARH